MMQRVIVIGSNPATKLSLIRCVGAVEGCRVTVVTMLSQVPEKPERTIDTYSKYVERFFYTKKYDADGLANLLLEKCRVGGEKPILMSVDDDSACLVDTIQDRLRDKFYYSHIQHQAGAIAGLMDKSKQKQLAKECGFNVVEAWPVDCVNGKYTVPDEVKYPCYVKGRLSYHSAKRYQKRCNTKEELEKWLKVLAKHNPSPLIIEEFIKINKEYGVIGYCNAEKVVLPGVVELIDCGYGSDRGVAASGWVHDFSLNEALGPKVEQLMRHIQLTGLFNIDFIESKGKWYFVELNVRYAAYGFAVCKAGVNLPAIQIYDVLSKDDSELSNEVKNDFRYVNEKVAFDDVAGGYRSWKNYRDMLRDADCRFIQQADDPEPYHQFKKGLVMKYVKSRIKKAIQKRNK